MSSANAAIRPPLAVAAVLFFSPAPDKLAAFYRQQLGLPLRRFTLPELAPHWACDIGHVYFSIWPAARPAPASGTARGGLAFCVGDVEQECERLVQAGVTLEQAPQRSPLGVIARLRDPEDNLFELYQPPGNPGRPATW